MSKGQQVWMSKGQQVLACAVDCGAFPANVWCADWDSSGPLCDGLCDGHALSGCCCCCRAGLRCSLLLLCLARMKFSCTGRSQCHARQRPMCYGIVQRLYVPLQQSLELRQDSSSPHACTIGQLTFIVFWDCY
jgi:hypothetical protein